MIDLNNFTPYMSLFGGILIGLSASILLLFNGKICGISGITGQLLSSKTKERIWRLNFFLGLIFGGFLISRLFPDYYKFESNSSIIMLIIAGLLVGYGTRLGNGCTSGHGVCGISRLSVRSMVATIAFMAVGIITVYVMNIL